LSSLPGRTITTLAERIRHDHARIGALAGEGDNDSLVARADAQLSAEGQRRFSAEGDARVTLDPAGWGRRIDFFPIRQCFRLQPTHTACVTKRGIHRDPRRRE
jgi:hypothetical protein